MREDLQDLFELKNDLWAGRLEQLKGKVSKDWNLSDLQKVIKSLKNTRLETRGGWSGYATRSFRADERDKERDAVPQLHAGLQHHNPVQK